MPKIDEHEFEGLFESPDKLKNQAGIYAIVRKEGNEFTIIDIGESNDVQSRVSNHDREDCWKRNSNPSSLKFGALYTPNMTEDQRRKIENDIRSKRNLVCGVI